MAIIVYQLFGISPVGKKIIFKKLGNFDVDFVISLSCWHYFLLNIYKLRDMLISNEETYSFRRWEDEDVLLLFPCPL